MFRSWRLGKAFGIPLYLHPTFLLLPVMVLADEAGTGWFNALVMMFVVAAVFGCVLLHELGHALTARAFGIRTRDITLYPIGGVASLERMAEAPFQEMAIAIAGPAVNLVIVGLLLPLVVFAYVSRLLGPGDLPAFHYGDGPALLLAKFVSILALSNGVLMVFNLLPAFPMDGGRVFRAFLALLMNRVRATEIAVGVGAGLAGLLVFVGLASPFTGFGSPLLALVGLFVVFAARMELLSVRRQADQARQAAYEEEDDVPPTADFSGFRWDRRSHVWVLWRNGRPTEVYEGGAE